MRKRDEKTRNMILAARAVQQTAQHLEQTGDQRVIRVLLDQLDPAGSEATPDEALGSAFLGVAVGVAEMLADELEARSGHARVR